MTLKRLAEIGTELGLTFNKNQSREKRARLILDVYAEQDLKQPYETPSSKDPLSLGEPKPDFERLIDGGIGPGAEEDVAAPQRGGPRPGAGRPAGMTDEIAAYNRLSLQPNPAIKGALELLFSRWAALSQCPDVKLTKEQAIALALPWTHIYELSPLGGRIPPWLAEGIMCIWTTWSIVTEKAALAREAAKQRKAVAAAPVSLN